MPTIELSAHAKAVHNFYAKIDDRDIPAALACFASAAVYRRPGFQEFDGLSAIEDFYRQVRDVGNGHHVVEAIVETGHEIAIRGRFEGFFSDGAPLQIRFADFWKFAQGKVIERNSYLFQNDGRAI
jgi:ketosteroid isomerase-like protein